ncbi:GH92 family glycosyl hydrolase [Parabacteroides distasonis]|uniref:Alpha-mannosidase n=1 Tax=Parabacteroides distasonis TaxID=823 RepID=A0A4S2EPB8_PARDI|nr:GH92 family glycosyl hydrolase [Parabacteroides distasonis]TGY56031.1 alpha-mannosidase [Parabacteroides distasonis]
MRFIQTLSSCLCTGIIALFTACSQVPQSPIDSVDPFIGTGFHGHTYPGATAPYGAVQLSPDTRKGNWDACSGYHYSDSTLIGFSHTHLSGTGCIDLGDILFRPSLQTPLVFSHSDEKASPGYYSVNLREAGVLAELTTTPHVGIHRYTYKKGIEATLVIDMDHLLDNEYIYEGWVKQTGENELTGMRRTRGWVDNQYVFFVARFSQPFSSMEQPSERQAVLTFDTTTGKPIVCKVGVSIVNEENARLNLVQETDSYDFDFDAIHQATRSDWEKELDAITVEGGTEAERTNFYTALYHSKIIPNIASDVNGQYRRHDMSVATIPAGRRQFSTFSTWDTFRAWHPMITLLDTTLVNDMVQSLLDMYDASGELPLWPLSAGETGTMIGYHSTSIIADAYLKGIRGYDAEHALEAMKISAEKNKKGADYYIKEGFIPTNIKKESVSCLLEFAYDDWCIAQMAKALGHMDDYETFIKHSQNFINVFDGSTRFFRGKRQDGNWETPFDPFAIGRSYTEATAWQYRFFTPHDVYGLTQLFGGKEAFIAELDSLFTVTSEVVGDLVDVTGLVGQYAHGNEPSHHMAYLYSYVGEPWKTQEWTRRLLDEMYQPTPEGIIGNEDCGQMSAWYLLSSLGFYSVCPGSNQFILTTPLFDKATVKLGNGKTLTVTANQPEKNKYITSVSLNGKEIKHCYITYDQLMQGGTLDFTLSSTPDKRWGTAPEYAPYSYTEQPTVSIPYIANDLDLFESEITAELKSTTPEAVIHYTLDGSEPDENAPVYSEPLVLKETTTIKAKGYKKGFVPSRTYSIQATKAVLRPALSIQPTKHGVAYTYYEGKFQWVADLQKAKVVETGTMPEPSILNAKLPDHFGYIFTGYIYAPEDGVYEFSTRSDDGSVLYIGKEKVVDNDASHAAIDATGRIPLQKGYHPFALHYFEDYEGEYLGWNWCTPSMSKPGAIPTENLYIN